MSDYTIPELRAWGEVWTDVSMRKARYQDGSIAIALYDNLGELLGIPTVSLRGGYGLIPVEGACFVKGYSEGEGLVDELVKRGVLKRTGRTVRYGPYDAFAEECRFVGEYAGE